MNRLEELRAKYRFEGGQYQPNPSCKFCKGTGERVVRDQEIFCICLFVAPHHSDFAGDTLGAVVRKLREEMASSDGPSPTPRKDGSP